MRCRAALVPFFFVVACGHTALTAHLKVDCSKASNPERCGATIFVESRGEPVRVDLSTEALVNGTFLTRASPNLVTVLAPDGSEELVVPVKGLVTIEHPQRGRYAFRSARLLSAGWTDVARGGATAFVVTENVPAGTTMRVEVRVPSTIEPLATLHCTVAEDRCEARWQHEGEPGQQTFEATAILGKSSATTAAISLVEAAASAPKPKPTLEASAVRSQPELDRFVAEAQVRLQVLAAGVAAHGARGPVESLKSWLWYPVTLCNDGSQAPKPEPRLPWIEGCRFAYRLDEPVPGHPALYVLRARGMRAPVRELELTLRFGEGVQTLEKLHNALVEGPLGGSAEAIAIARLPATELSTTRPDLLQRLSSKDSLTSCLGLPWCAGSCASALSFFSELTKSNGDAPLAEVCEDFAWLASTTDLDAAGATARAWAEGRLRAGVERLLVADEHDWELKCAADVAGLLPLGAPARPKCEALTLAQTAAIVARADRAVFERVAEQACKKAASCVEACAAGRSPIEAMTFLIEQNRAFIPAATLAAARTALGPLQSTNKK